MSLVFLMLFIFCFLVFRPQFYLVDDASGESTLFTGRFTLNVVGGGKTLSSVREYTAEERVLYNSETSDSTAR